MSPQSSKPSQYQLPQIHKPVSSHWNWSSRQAINSHWKHSAWYSARPILLDYRNVAPINERIIKRLKCKTTDDQIGSCGEKKRVFCDGSKELAFLCNGTDQHEIQAKNVNRCMLLSVNRTVLKIFPSRGDFAPKPLELHWWDGESRGCRSGVTFSTWLRLPSITGTPTLRPPESTFCAITVLAVEAPKVTQISLSDR